MNKHNQNGAISGVVVSLILAVLLLFGAIGFGAWAYTSRQDYKDNSDAKSAAAAEAAKQAESKSKDKQFAEEIKNPLRTYIGPEAYGSISVAFPKTWSGYVDDTGKGASLVDGYFAPNTVPSIADRASVFALRLQVLDRPYAETVKSLDTKVKNGKIVVTAYSLPKLPKIVGVKAVGELAESGNSTTIILPLRSSTLQISTQGTQYLNDFNDIILKNITFSP